MTLSLREWILVKVLLKNQLTSLEAIRESFRKGENSSSLEEFLKKKLTPSQQKKVTAAVEKTLEILEETAYGSFALEMGWLSSQKLHKAQQIARSSSKMRLWDILRFKNWITPSQHKKLEKKVKEYREALEKSCYTLDSLFKGSPKRRRLRFGEMALHKLFITEEQLAECLTLQQEMKKKGIHKRLGELLFEKSYINEIQVQKIISAMEKGDEQIIENYVIEKKIGEGASGVVFKAYLQGSQTPVALKVLRPHVSESRETLQRFIEEAKQALTLRHPNIVQAYEVGVSEDYYYYTMEYVEGKSLRELLNEQIYLPIPQAIQITIDVAKALEYAFEQGIVHRDIKPDNILIESASGKAKLCDLGIAKNLHKDFSSTQKGMVMGTPYYISPELAKGENIDIRSDLYSLGVTLYRMVTGRLPFEGSSIPQVLMKHITLPPCPPSRFRKDLPFLLEEAILKLLEKRPSKRFSRPKELIHFLTPLLKLS